jgi:hypothetical protein
MNRNGEIIQLSKEMMLDITEGRIPLCIVLLKGSRLSSLLDMPESDDWFKRAAKYAEANQFVVENFRTSLEAAKDPNVSVSSANPNEWVNGTSFGGGIKGNIAERNYLRNEANKVIGYLANYRTEAYAFASKINQNWQFGNIAETIFEKKRKNVEPVLQKLFPDTDQRLNSIEQNLRSQNPEDWKNAVGSCRALIMDIADLLNPPISSEDKSKYLNRLKDYVSPKVSSSTKRKLIKTFFDELKSRIEYTMDLTQEAAHQGRPSRSEAEDVVLYTYLVIAELMQIYTQHNTEKLVEAKLEKVNRPVQKGKNK